MKELEKWTQKSVEIHGIMWNDVWLRESDVGFSCQLVFSVQIGKW